jgi:acetyl-CoA carboxylase carboxyltransferase component
MFRNNAKMSAMGITQIAAVTGACVAGGAYLPIMSDETLMVEEAGSIFLAGPYLVKAAVGEDIDAETLGGAVTHTEISGIADYKFKTEQDCLDQVKKIMDKLGPTNYAGFNRTEPKNPIKGIEEIYSVQSEGNTKTYNMLDIIDSIVDADSLDEFKQDYGKSIICGYARVDGWAVGIVANQRLVVKNKKGEMQLGGVIMAIVPIKQRVSF